MKRLIVPLVRCRRRTLKRLPVPLVRCRRGELKRLLVRRLGRDLEKAPCAARALSKRDHEKAPCPTSEDGT